MGTAELSEIAAVKNVQIAVAESLTAGLLAGAIGSGAGASEWFRGGVVAYQTAVKNEVLGVDGNLDPCSPEVARQLAAGVRDLLRADLAISTTGVGGPEDDDGHPPGEVYLGWATADAVGHRRLELKGEPHEILAATVDAALELLTSLAREAGDRARQGV